MCFSYMTIPWHYVIANPEFEVNLPDREDNVISVVDMNT